MKTMLNEKKYVENKIINPMSKQEKINTTKPFLELEKLSRYYYHIEKLDIDSIRTKLYEFLDYCKCNYNKVKSESTIEGILVSCQKRPLTIIESIGITEIEMKIIKTLKDERLEKFLFGLLCCAKAHNEMFEKNNNWVNEDSMEIYKSCRLRSRDKDDRFMLLNKLLNISYNGNPYISISKKNTNRNIRIEFVDYTSDIVLKIEDAELNELGYTYMNYYGKCNITQCQHCGKLIKIKSKFDSSTKYCDGCAREINYYEPMNTKIIKCVDCNKEFEVDSKSRRIRCDECYKIERQRINKNYNNKTSSL